MTDPLFRLERDANPGGSKPHGVRRGRILVAWLSDTEADDFAARYYTGPLPADPPRFTAEVVGTRTIYVNIADADSGEVYTIGPFCVDGEAHQGTDLPTAAAFVAHVNAPRFPQPPAEDLPPGVVASVDDRYFYDCSEAGLPSGWLAVQKVAVRLGFRPVVVLALDPVKVRLHQLAGRRLPGCDWTVTCFYGNGSAWTAEGAGNVKSTFTVDADGYVDVQPEPTDADA